MTLRTYEQKRRRREFDRMLSALRRGVPRERISGDRDVLQAAVETYNREATDVR